MTDLKTNFQNAFETTLTAQMAADGLVATVASLGNPSLTDPVYLCLDFDDDEKREYILFDGTFGALTFVTTSSGNRYLAGSAYPSNIVHESGAAVVMVPAAQHFGDLHDRIDSLDHSDLGGLTAGDPHTQYLLDSAHAADDHSALSIDADMVDGQHASEFAADDHNHTGVYAPEAHVDSRDGHPVVTTSLDGLMTGADKTILDALESGGGGIAGVTAGDGIDVSGSSVIEVSHEDTSSASNINNSPSEHVDILNVDEFGHVTSVTKQTMSAADIGASGTGHDHAGTYAPASHPNSGDHDSRYYTEGEVNSLLNAKLNASNPDVTGVLKFGSYSTLKIEGAYTKLMANNIDILSGDADNELYVSGVPHSNVQYDVRCTDPGGGGRQLYYYDDSSTERAKHDIEPSPLEGGECLKWDMYQFRKDLEGENGPLHQWTIAERIQEISGDDFIVRDDEGQIQNTDDRAMMADMVLTIQKLEDRITELETKQG
jgi:hypothetical protein